MLYTLVANFENIHGSNRLVHKLANLQVTPIVINVPNIILT